MGLLDDAIREHLDLQRRRGADPADVERAERDALGPVRRAPEGAEHEAELAPDLDSEPGLAHHAGEDGWGDEPAGEAFEYEDAGAHGLEPASEAHDPLPEPIDPPPVESHAAHDEPDLGTKEPDVATDEPDRAPKEPPPASSGSITKSATGAETVEYDVERALGNEEGGEDVLEETPEFLQDTPDHDRLWFEQRPPRDFDFDG
jgi:hypothetical protein